MLNNIKIIHTEENLKNIKVDCPNCGATEIYFDSIKGKLRCSYCKKLFEPNELNDIKDIDLLQNRVIGSGAKDITSNEHIMTIECVNCGAEVVIDTSIAPHARCHWCRSILSINNRIDNGSIPDAILPFKVSKQEALYQMKNFIHSRSDYAVPEFLNELNEENIVGVYLPYLLVDAKVEGSFKGRGEYIYDRYSIAENEERLDTEIYDLSRDFELDIYDLSVESNKEILNKYSARTNNIINSIMPFDTENCVKYESNYLIGYTSEKRDIDIKDVDTKVNQEINNIVLNTLNYSLKQYNAGVEWQKHDLTVLGNQWMSAYLPVWLYTYTEEVNGKKRTHYIAVNGRTKETMGSVPIDDKKFLKTYILLLSIVTFVTPFSILFGLGGEFLIGLVIMVFIALYFNGTRDYYRNATEKHSYEKDTKRAINYKVVEDNLLETKIGIPEISNRKYKK